MCAFCYILFSNKLNKYYIGSTPDIQGRLSDNKRGKEKFTKTGIPWIMAYKEIFDNLTKARIRELEIKKQKSRKYIERLISSAG